jgi:hypothetical protein
LIRFGILFSPDFPRLSRRSPKALSSAPSPFLEGKTPQTSTGLARRETRTCFCVATLEIRRASASSEKWRDVEVLGLTESGCRLRCASLHSRAAQIAECEEPRPACRINADPIQRACFAVPRQPQGDDKHEFTRPEQAWPSRQRSSGDWAKHTPKNVSFRMRWRFLPRRGDSTSKRCIALATYP